MKKVLIIIPAYNEEGSILRTVQSIESFKKRNHLAFQIDYLVINDGSKDKTSQILDEYNLNHVDLVRNLGIGGAVQTGYIYADRNNYDAAVQFDGDGQHDIASIVNLVTPVLDGSCDFVIGSRFVDKSKENFQSTAMRRMGINLISNLIKLTTHKRIYDTTSGYRVANKEIVSYFAKRYPVAYPEPETIVRILKKGYSVEEIPANMFERTEGVSSISALKSITYMVDVLLSIIMAAYMKEN
ncbi:TPA: glycosyltransferase family 2 protein [Streptococcus suis]